MEYLGPGVTRDSRGVAWYTADGKRYRLTGDALYERCAQDMRTVNETFGEAMKACLRHGRIRVMIGGGIMSALWLMVMVMNVTLRVGTLALLAVAWLACQMTLGTFYIVLRVAHRIHG